MIKKLFTLLTLALLAMPLAWGDVYYSLLGDFTEWQNGMANNNYKFVEDAGTYTFTWNFAGATHFKIVKVDTSTDPWTATWYGFESGQANIHHTNYANIPTSDDGNAASFYLQSGGSTTISFTLVDGKPKFTVTRPAALYLKGEFTGTGWTEELMTETATGWTASYTIAANKKFGFVDEFGQWHGNGGYNGWTIYNQYLDGTEIPIEYDGNYIMDVAGDFVINVNSDVTKMVIYQPKSLAEIQSSGVVGKTYIVSEPLQVVAASTVDNHTVAFARDLTGTTVTCPSGKVDYMTAVAKDHTGDWIQNNWVMLDFNGVSQVPSGLLNGTIAGGSLKGVYADNNNYTINVDPNATLSVTPGTEDSKYVPNVYCPANFGPNTDGVQKGYPVENGMSVGESANVDYWFLTPKPMEVFELSGALYYNSNDFDEGFYMEQRKQENNKWFNPAGLKGGIGFNTDYNSGTPGLVVGQSYRFLTVAMKSGSKSEPSYGEPLRDYTYSLQPEPDQTLNQNYEAAALNLGNGSSIVTGVNDVKTGSDVVSVTYCDLAGRMSQKPFAGVNIIVTRYSDGTIKTTKAIK